MLITNSCSSKNKTDINNQMDTNKYNPLTPEEEDVIIHKGTEKPFTGKYYKHFEKGTYFCKRCDAPLYRSESKFDSGSGWPSFDEEIPGAVKRVPDGSRTEIICANCGAHLGHVFEGEMFTPKNTRHCVNSISLNFIPDEPEISKAIFAGGCFWGVEFFFAQQKGVISTRVGYTGGTKPNPTYEEVCSGNTGHYEAVEITFKPNEISFEELAKVFFQIHDFEQPNGQGPDIGEQYKSVAFYFDDTQKQILEKLISKLTNLGYRVATKLMPAKEFWEAEEYHQKYYEKKGSFPYCHYLRKINGF